MGPCGTSDSQAEHERAARIRIRGSSKLEACAAGGLPGLERSLLDSWQLSPGRRLRRRPDAVVRPTRFRACVECRPPGEAERRHHMPGHPHRIESPWINRPWNRGAMLALLVLPVSCVSRAPTAKASAPEQPKAQLSASYTDEAAPGPFWAEGEAPADRLATGARIETDLDSGKTRLVPAAGWTAEPGLPSGQRQARQSQ